MMKPDECAAELWAIHGEIREIGRRAAQRAVDYFGPDGTDALDEHVIASAVTQELIETYSEQPKVLEHLLGEFRAHARAAVEQLIKQGE